VLDMLREDKK